jgi:hypothetical protein
LAPAPGQPGRRRCGAPVRPGRPAAWRAVRGRGFLARQHQQLLDQARGAVDAGGQAADGHLARFRRIGAVQALRLQAQRGQRRAQFVGGVGDEVLLGVEGRAHAPEQQIQFVHQRAHFVRQAGFRHRRQIVGLARATCERTRATGSSEPLTTHQTTSIRIGIITAIGPQRAQRQVAGHVAAHGQVLRDLHGLVVGLDREHAVGGAVGLDVGKTEHRALRQARARDAVEHLHAVRGPHLHHQVVVARAGLEPLLRFGVRQRRAGAQRQRHLLHVVVEDLVGVVERRAVGDRGLGQCRQGDGRQQEPEQAPAQRVGHFHAFGTM